MNILILSCGTRDKVVQYFRRSRLVGSVIAADCSPLAPALYEAHGYYIVPRITDPRYTDVILGICEKEKISGVLSLIDPELSLIARERERFRALGVQIIGSPCEPCELALDKWRMYLFLRENGYACARSFIEWSDFAAALGRGELAYPVFVKPRFGSASLSISSASDEATARFLFERQPDMMIQETLSGSEIGADCYVDLVCGRLVSAFTKKKLAMRAGETDKAVSFRDERLFELLGEFLCRAGFSGPVDVDLFERDGGYLISEVNPRFGGGYPHAYECGVDFPSLILNNLCGNANECKIGDYPEGVYMMKYNDVMISYEPGGTARGKGAK